jgi:predicted PurR-regulated permease PerM
MFGREKNPQAKYILFGFIVLILILTFFILKPFFISILSAAVIAYIFYPLYKWIRKFIKNDTASSIVICVLIVLLFLVPLFIVLNMLVKQTISFYYTASDFMSSNTFDVSKINNFILDKTGIHIDISSIVLTLSGYFVNWLKEFLTSIPSKILNLVIMIFLLYYFFKDGEKIISYLKEFIPLDRKKKEFVINEIGSVTNGLVFGQVLAAVAQGILGMIGFYIFGIKSAVFLGLIMIFFGLIPFIGTPFVWVPASLYLVFTGMINSSSVTFFKGIGLFFYGLLLIANIDNLIRTYVGAGQARLHPVIVFIGVIGGIATFGIIGIVIGPVILSLFFILLKFYKHEKA